MTFKIIDRESWLVSSQSLHMWRSRAVLRQRKKEKCRLQQISENKINFARCSRERQRAMAQYWDIRRKSTQINPIQETISHLRYCCFCIIWHVKWCRKIFLLLCRHGRHREIQPGSDIVTFVRGRVKNRLCALCRDFRTKNTIDARQ
jgi:hypothetical protein